MGRMKDIDIEIKNSPALSYILDRVEKLEEQMKTTIRVTDEDLKKIQELKERLDLP